jgi:hypothetical protein
MLLSQDRKRAFLRGMRKQSNITIAALAAMVCLLAAPGAATAQSRPHAQTVKSGLDLAVTFVGDRTNPVGGENTWLTGGGVELGINAWHGLGAAVHVTGLHSASINAQNVPISLVTTTFGPRYRYTKPFASGRRSISPFGEALVGEANAFHGLFPSPQGATDSANSLALEMGGGLDISLSRHFAVRAIQAQWVRTQLPNNGTSVQNHLQLGSGLVAHF